MALKNVGGLWRGKPNSKAVLSGTIELEGKDGPKTKVFVFKNEDRANDRQPEFRICFGVEDEEGQRPARREASREDFQVSDDDVPFSLAAVVPALPLLTGALVLLV